MMISSYFSGQDQKISRLIMAFIYIFNLLGSNLIFTQTPSLVLQKEILKIIDRETQISLDQHNGFTIGVIDGDSTWHLSFGSNIDKGGDPISPLDVFEIGGLTKVFTADLCYRLQEKGQISLEITAGDCLSELVKNSSVGPISLSRLLNHTSGLPNLPDNLAGNAPGHRGRYSDYHREDLLRFLIGCSGNKKSNHYQYSHLNYALVQLMVESLTGENWDHLMRKYLWEVDSMICSGSSLDAQLIPLDGYNRSGIQVMPWEFQSFMASEGMLSCMYDLAQYVILLINKQDRQQQLKNMSHPSNESLVEKGIYASHGWHVIRRGKKPDIFLHSGKTEGHAASIHMIPDTHTAVIILAKSTSSLDGLAMHILRMINFNWKRKN